MMDADGVRPDGHTYIELLAAWYGDTRPRPRLRPPLKRHEPAAPRSADGNAPHSTDRNAPP
jgi:hypothetical protein